MSIQETLTNHERIVVTQIVWVFVVLFLVLTLWVTRSQLASVQELVTSQQEVIVVYDKHFKSLEEDVDKLQMRSYVTPDELEKVRKSGYDYSWEIYEEMRDFMNKAEARLPILKRI